MEIKFCENTEGDNRQIWAERLFINTWVLPETKMSSRKGKKKKKCETEGITGVIKHKYHPN